MREMKIWDLPTRLFHWALVACVLVSWGSAEWDYFTIHYYSGYCVMTLILFRLAWGVFGSDTARISALFTSPGRVIRYAIGLPSRETEEHAGHNPLGGYSVLALLGLLTAQVATGLFAQDIDFINSGPLADMISFDAGQESSELHHLLFDVLFILVCVHIAANLFYLVYKKQNLIRAMFTGWQRFSDKGPFTPPTLVPTTRAALLLVIAALVTLFVVFVLPGL